MCGAASVCQAGHCGPSWAMGQAAAAAAPAQGQPQTHVLGLARGGRVGSDTARPGRLWLPQAARGPAAAGREPRHESGGFTLAEGKTALRGGLLGGRGHSPLHVICLYLFPLITKSVR